MMFSDNKQIRFVVSDLIFGGGSPLCIVSLVVLKVCQPLRGLSILSLLRYGYMLSCLLECSMLMNFFSIKHLVYLGPEHTLDEYDFSDALNFPL